MTSGADTDRKLVELADVLLSADAELIGRIEAGKLKSFEVEAQRRDAGLPLLAGWADPAGFDPMKQVAWPLIMAVAWIMWRSPEAVREQWSEYRAQSTFWNTRTDANGDELITREFLDQKPQHSVDRVIASAHAHDGLQHVAASDTVDELLYKLQDDTNGFIATGLPMPNGRREKIPSHEWFDMMPFDGDRHHDGAGPQSENEPRWYEVKVRRDDVLRLWPKLKPIIRGSKRGRRAVERPRVKAQMLNDLKHGRLDHDEKQEALAARYGASRETCVLALAEALSEFELATMTDTEQFSAG